MAQLPGYGLSPDGAAHETLTTPDEVDQTIEPSITSPSIKRLVRVSRRAISHSDCLDSLSDGLLADGTAREIARAGEAHTQVSAGYECTIRPPSPARLRRARERRAED